MNLKPLLFIAGAAGALAAAAKRRPKALQRVVQTVTPGGGGEEQPRERYEPPIEAGAQPPAEPGGPPSSQSTAIEAEPVVTQPGGQLNVPEHPLPEGVVMPDTSDDDPLVREQEKAAAGDAGAIGGNVNAMAAEDESFERDEAARPVAEGSGDEGFETFETREDVERSNREVEP
jgi:hypothetical protein